MKYNQFNNAYNALQKLSNMNLPVRDAYNVYKLTKEIDQVYQFGVERERALIEQYKGQPNQDGTIRFVHGDDEESKREGVKNMIGFSKAIDELNNTEMDCEFSPITISYDSLGDQTMTAKEIMSLDGFVELVGD